MNGAWLRYPLSNLDLEKKKTIKLYNYIFLLFPTVSLWRLRPTICSQKCEKSRHKNNI